MTVKHLSTTGSDTETAGSLPLNDWRSQTAPMRLIPQGRAVRGTEKR